MNAATFSSAAIGDAGDLDLGRRRAAEKLHRRLDAQALLEGVARQFGTAPELRPLVGIGGEQPEQVADRGHGRVDARRQERAHQHSRFVARKLAGVDGGVDHRAESVGRQRLAGAIGHDPAPHRVRVAEGGLGQRVLRPERIEHHRAIGQQVLAALLRQAERVRKDLGRIDSAKSLTPSNEPIATTRSTSRSASRSNRRATG